MYKNISIEKALQDPGTVCVDVRSEGEFAEDTIPGAVNIPLLNNEERARVGMVYKQEGQEAARLLGLKLVAPKLSRMVDEFAQVAKDKKVTVFCWRGGARSEATAALLNSLGFKVNRVLGGYKAYRRLVNDFFNRESLSWKALVLHGLTGVGKTDVIERLAGEGIPALDLEGLAEHRGSVYGKIGLPPSPSQKKFESLIFDFFCRNGQHGVFVVECESRRLGRLILPNSLVTTMHQGYNVLLYAGLENRIKRIERDYTDGTGANIEDLQEATAVLVKRLGKAKVDDLNKLLADQKIKEVIGYMLTDYYDPLYKYPKGPSKDYDLSISTDNLTEAVMQVKKFVTGLPEYKSLKYEVG